MNGIVVESMKIGNLVGVNGEILAIEYAAG